MIIEITLIILLANLTTDFIIKQCCNPRQDVIHIVVNGSSSALSLDTVAPIIEEKGDLIYESCSICFESFIDVDVIRKTKCNHSFCDACIKEWLNKSSRCPLCNNEFLLTNV